MNRRGRAPAFVVPAAIRGATRTPSGGNTYNAYVLEHWPKDGLALHEVPVDGSWPWPTEADRSALARAIAGRPVVLVDGLVGSCCPDQIAAAVAAGTRVVLLVHLPLPAETDLSAEQAAYLERLERAAVGASSAVLATSHWAGRDVARRYHLRQPVRVAVPGSTRSPVARGSCPPRFLVLASLTPRKNHAVVLDALAQLADLDWQCAFVGPVPSDRSVSAGLFTALNASPVQDRIEISGALDEVALAAAWDRTDLVLLPSLIETFGLVVTEGLAHGLPAVVASGSGAVEALCGGDPAQVPDHDRSGAVADPGDPAAWVTILRRWLDDPHLRERWQALALRRRETARDWTTTASDVAAAVFDAEADGSPAGPTPR